MAPEVRLNGVDNEPLGIVPTQEALRMAGDLDVDLVEIAAQADPPVCRLMDYGKFKYQEQKRAAEAKSKQKIIGPVWSPGRCQKRLKAYKTATLSPAPAAQIKRSSHAQNEDQERREEAFSRPSGWHRQAGPGVQAPHPHQ